METEAPTKELIMWTDDPAFSETAATDDPWTGPEHAWASPENTADSAANTLDFQLTELFARWLEVRMAELQPGIAQLLVELGRISGDEPLHLQASEAATRWQEHYMNNAADLQLERLRHRLGLSPVDVAIVLAVWTLGEDLKLDALRRQGFNDDAFFEARLIARLVGNLWAVGKAGEAAVMTRLSAEAPLRRYKLVHLNAPASRPNTALRNHFIELDEAASAWVESRPHWPDALAPFVERHTSPVDVGRKFFEDQLNRLDRALTADMETPWYVALCSSSLQTSRALAGCWCARHDRPLYQFDLSKGLANGARLNDLFPLLAREARLHDALVLVAAGREWDEVEDSLQHQLLNQLPALSILAGSPIVLDAPLKGEEAFRRHLDPLFEVRTLPPTLDEQVEIWSEALAASELQPLPERALREQVCDLALEIGDIQRAVRLSATNAWLLEDERREAEGNSGEGRDEGEPGAGKQGEGKQGNSETSLAVDAENLRAMAASKLNQGMNGVAERVMTTLTWTDLIAPDEVLEGLMDVITYARYQRQVFEGWGFASKMPYGRANSCLFSGPPGTGKTMAAGVIARELGMDLFRVDLSQIMSKWVGETEKNLAKVFDEASRGHAVLLFDEADSLFGKRTSVKSSNDRYNNLQVNYLLQRIESFEGITILTSNLADSIDDAFARRIKFKVDFPVPDAAERSLLWEVMLPADASKAPEIDFKHLGESFEMAGGHIKNSVLRAAFRAAECGEPINTRILEQAGIAELREMGKLVRVDDDGRLITPDVRQTTITSISDAKAS